MLRLSLLPVLVAALTCAASAQTIVINPNKGNVLPASAATQVRISLGISMFVPSPGEESAKSLQAQEDGRKLVYEAAAHECEILRATIAADCQLESININVQRINANQNYAQKTDGYNINGSMNYRVLIK